MRLLVVGGTRFVGRHIVQSATSRGHQVTVFHRGTTAPGVSGDGAGDGAVEYIHGDRFTDLSRLAGREWDATVDVCAYFPRAVHELAVALGGAGGRHLLVSTVSVYAPPPGPGITEDADLVAAADATTETVTPATYGALKVACEQAAARAYGPDLLVLRPTYVVGPYDYTWRFPTWVRRIAAGGEVACPSPADIPMQVIDARDQADFAVSLLERGIGGTFHTASPRPPFSLGDLLAATVEAVAPPGTRLVWLDGDFLTREGLDDSAFPFWAPGEADFNVMAADPSAALAAGLQPRALTQTIHDTATWAAAAGDQQPPGRGLDRAREADLIRRGRA